MKTMKMRALTLVLIVAFTLSCTNAYASKRLQITSAACDDAYETLFIYGADFGDNPKVKLELELLTIINSTEDYIEATLPQGIEPGTYRLAVTRVKHFKSTFHSDRMDVTIGAIGQEGAQGDVGPQGPQGDVGPQGTQGELGPTGADGAPGVAGTMGPQGDQGEQGPPGVDGTDCADGECPITLEMYNELLDRLDALENRFTDMGDGTVRDNNTGLIWLKDADEMGTGNWYDATAAAATLSDGEHGLTDGSSDGDWRLPTVWEWTDFVVIGEGYSPALCNTAGTAQWTQGNAFIDVQSSDYWSSTDGGLLFEAWEVDLNDGSDNLELKEYNGKYIWPVRSDK